MPKEAATAAANPARIAVRAERRAALTRVRARGCGHAAAHLDAMADIPARAVAFLSTREAQGSNPCHEIEEQMRATHLATGK